ncbi:DEAD-box ATP-dependent RNA helicase 31-like [Humulus lupulus]|uniref:DEAD-box ATP-dependent RNA helicase 31-like n=1 Tax=Humulus lupulus TaxID=3486 RepID=UPI002B40CE18|nr:DEAD-box ATP-dependent RNA helicase 31-like [Humulus lupulus]
MPVKLFHQLRLLNPAFPATCFSSMKFGPSISASETISSFSRMFPFKLKYRCLGSIRAPQNNQLGMRKFSTRPFRSRTTASGSEYGRGRGEVRASKSLVEDEAELSDWVSELKEDSFRGRLNSEDESDGSNRGRRGRSGDIGSRGEMGGGDRGRRDRNRDIGSRDSFSVKKRRGESDSDDANDSSRGRTRTPIGSRSRDSQMNKRFDTRGGGVSDEAFPRKRSSAFQEGKVSSNSFAGKRGGRDTEFGYNRNEGNKGLRNDGKGLRKQVLLMEEDKDEDDEGKRLGIGALLSEEDSEIDEDDEDEQSSGPLIGLNKEVSAKGSAASSTGKSDSYLSETSFDKFPVSPLSLKAIKDVGYEKMTVVQEATLPLILKGKDVLAKAKTGTGKTVAFLLPAIEVVVKSTPIDRDQKRPPIFVLVICPTRELACQAAAEANTLLKYHPSIGVQVVIGGTRLALEQKRMQANPCQILVATPGRLRDHMENTAGFATRMMGVKVLVLDEADHLLDMGFRKDIERIIAAVPKQRQTLLFSATVPEEVRQVCHIALKRDHDFVDTVKGESQETNSQVRQTCLVAPLDKQFSLLYVLLKEHIADDVDYKVIMFCTTAMVTRLVADLLGELKLNVREIHSRKSQSYRTKVSDEFRKSKGLILVTSDVSARGVDYPDVSLVIQVGVPADREQYIHRLGRTGRKGKEGQGVLLLAPWEEFFLSSIKALPITKASLPSVDPDTRKKVERALSNVEMKSKEAAYQAWLGYYNSNKAIARDKNKLVELANEFSRSMGLDNPPAIPKLVLGKMGLRNVPGLRSR